MNMFYNNNNNLNLVFFDAAKKLRYFFQDPATNIMEGIIDLHHDLMFFLIIILIFVLYFLLEIIISFISMILNPLVYRIYKKKTKIKTYFILLELFWILMPSWILYHVVMPSFTLLYSMDDWEQPDLTLKMIGNQWFWTYEYSDYIFTFWNKYKGSFEYDSYMLLEKELYWGELRLLEVDNRICMPLYTNMRLLITSSDVLHCWTMPSLGVKLDACPGRLNQTFFFTNSRGVFYGQCSEICGMNHGFMPIVLESVNISKYLSFLKSFNMF